MTATPPIRAVVCDFGGVLTTPLVESFARFQHHAGLTPQELGLALADITAAEGENPLYRLERGEMTEPDFLALVGAALEARVGRPVAMHEFTDRYWAALHPNEEMLALIREVRDAGYRTALLTNNVREWEPRWRRVWPIDELFEIVVDSAFVGMRKPERGIYELTVQRLGVQAAECLFVDDVEHNCDGAREAGMRAVWFRDTEQAVAEIRSALGGPAQLSQPSRSQR